MSLQLIVRSSRLKLVAGTTNRLTLQLRPPPRVSMSLGIRGPQGPTGPQGEPGVASAQQYVADETISALRVLTPTTTGHVQYAQPTDVTLVGISVTAALAGDLVTVACTDHVVEDGSWSWTPAAPIFCADNGVLTQIAPASGVLLVVGYAHSATQLVVRFGQPITLA